MQYRAFGKTGKKLSGLGWGTNRFDPADLQSADGIERAAELIVRGVEQGINYIDCGHTYAMGRAEEILALSLKEICQRKYSCYTSTKVMYMEDPSSDAARRRIETGLRNMNIDRADFAFAWRVSSYDEFIQIIRPGGLYDGLMRAKEDGLVEHICFSSHASAEDTVKIMESGKFDGCMISCNILNMHAYRMVFEAAKQHGMGLFTMNSLGGGVIPRLRELSARFPERDGARSLAGMSLRALYGNEEITTCLSSMKNAAELQENLSAFQENQNPAPRYADIAVSAPYCTKCRYCAGCPVGLPVCDIMYGYNNLIFPDLTAGYGKYNADAPEQLFNPRFLDYNATPKSEVNPCIKCGRCEKRCTQKLPIIQRIEEFYQAAAAGSYTRAQRKKRLAEKIRQHNGQSICLFPAGKYTQYVLEEYLQFFGSFPEKLYVSDNNEELWGRHIVTDAGSIPIISPRELKQLSPDLLLVTNYFYGEQICEQLLESDLLPAGTRLEKLHQAADIPWY